MRTIDPAILLAAMTVLQTPPPPPGPARLAARARRVTFAPVTPSAITVARAA